MPVAPLPDASVAVQVTEVVPTAKVEPEAGRQPTTGAGSTTSDADGVANETAMPSGPGALADGEGRPPRSGAVVSTTVTANEPVALAPAVSVASHAIVVVPRPRRSPGAGVQSTAGSGSSSVSVAVATNAAVQPPVVLPSTVVLPGRSSSGAAFAATDRTICARVPPLTPPDGALV